jgi:uncharacterized protein (TIGR02444 family)
VTAYFSEMLMPESDTSTSSTPFWRFSLRIYRQPGVGDACIALQDGCGVDVNLLLFMMWLAAARQRLTQDDAKNLDDMVRGWRHLTIIPIRDVRRGLKEQATIIEAGKQEAFRTRIKAIELEAERLQQEALYELLCQGPLGTPAAPSEAVRANVTAYQRVLGKDFPTQAVETLIAAFDGVDHSAFAPGRE